MKKLAKKIDEYIGLKWVITRSIALLILAGASYLSCSTIPSIYIKKQREKIAEILSQTQVYYGTPIAIKEIRRDESENVNCLKLEVSSPEMFYIFPIKKTKTFYSEPMFSNNFEKLHQIKQGLEQKINSSEEIEIYARETEKGLSFNKIKTKKETFDLIPNYY